MTRDARHLHALLNLIDATLARADGMLFFDSGDQVASFIRRLAEEKRVDLLRATSPALRFHCDGEAFHTLRGVWCPSPRAMSAAIQLYVLAHCPNVWIPFAPPSPRALHGVLGRAIESLAQVDPRLANTLAFARGHAPGLHLHQRGRLVWGMFRRAADTPRFEARRHVCAPLPP